MTCTNVERIDANGEVTTDDSLTVSYRCYFLNSQDGTTINNDFKVGSQAICKVANINEGLSDGATNKYYWRLVTSVGSNYIDLSKNDCDAGSDIPEAGDSIVAYGHRTDTTLQSIITLSTIANNAPSIMFYSGVNGYSLNDKSVLELVIYRLIL